MKNKKLIVTSTLLLVLVLLVVGTVAYFRRTVNGNITGQSGNLVLIVNEANAELDETFDVVLTGKNGEDFIMPDDSGAFDINIVSTGSSTDVAATITISRTNLPDNLKFYLDEAHTQELVTKTYILEHAATMEKTVPVYWFWDGSKDDNNDNEYIDMPLTANITVTATSATFYSSLLAQDVTLDTNVDFKEGASSTNGQGLMMVSGTEDDKYPIVYYRGDVTNNNVIFADYCWLIVRTTETGGIKLIYNGEVNEDGSCTNFSGVGGETANSTYQNAYINQTTSVFNEKNDSPVYVGYMYNDTNTYFTHKDGWTSTSPIDPTGTLDTEGYKSHLADNTIDTSTNRHNQNLKDSTVKGVIDDWYEENILNTNAKNLIEDTVWCNDRSISDIDNYVTNKSLDFNAQSRVVDVSDYSPTLACARDVDKFTVDSKNGNGDLTYPVGMLTADEIKMAGNTLYTGNLVTTYLTMPSHQYWSLTPNYFRLGGAFAFHVANGEIKHDLLITTTNGVRPSVSLKTSVTVSDGDGSFAEPFIIG